MTGHVGATGLSDAEWAVWEPRVEAVRPRGRTPPEDLRRTVAAVFWRHNNGAKRRAVPPELGPRSRAAQLFIRRAGLGVRDRLLLMAQERAGGLALSMAFLDGTSIRAHAKAAGAARKRDQAQAEMSVKRLVALAAATARGR